MDLDIIQERIVNNNMKIKKIIHFNYYKGYNKLGKASMIYFLLILS